jgi:hypothetical protein
MRFITTGVGEDGRSAVLSVDEHPLTDEARQLWRAPTVPPPLPHARRASGAGDTEGSLGRGSGDWNYVAYDSGHVVDMHQVDAFALITFIRGQAELVLENGAIDLQPGDCVVMPGIMHAWHPGPGGCEFAAVRFGAR